MGALKWIDHAMPMAFLLRRDTKSKQLDSFRLKPIGDATKLHDKMRGKIKEWIENESNKKRPIRDFEKYYDVDGIAIMDVEKSSFVNETIKTIFEMSSSNPIDSLKSMQSARYSAVLFSLPNQNSIVAIDTVAVYHQAFGKVGHLLSYDDDVSDLDGMILFKFDMPCIYFEKLNKLLVLDRKATETMFNLIEHYQNKIEGRFEGLVSEGIIDMDVRDLRGWTKNITAARRVNAMIQKGLFDQEIDVYKKYKKYLNEHPDIDDDELRLEIINDRISILDEKHFKSFLNFAETNLQQSVIDPNDRYVAMRKRRVVTRGAAKGRRT